MKPKTSYYMADFAASDRRSVKAHLAGKSIRAKAYVVFEALAGCFGRAEKSPEDFQAISRFFFKRRKLLRSFRQAVMRIATAIFGLFCGGALYYWMSL